jgi:hypothetical protein
MKENISCRRYYVQEFGGLPFIEMQRTTARDVMYVRGLENLIDGMIFP